MPGLNFVYADVDGNIGWIAAARTPDSAEARRPAAGPRRRRLRVAGLPRRRATCRRASTRRPAGSRPPTTTSCPTATRTRSATSSPRRTASSASASGSRRRRSGRWRTSARSSTTTTSLPGLALAKLLKGVDLQGHEPGAVREAADATGTAGCRSIPRPGRSTRSGCTSLQQRVLRRRTCRRNSSPPVITLGGLPALLAALEKPDAHWFGEDPTAGRDQLLRETFAAAVEKLKKLPAAQQRRWGALHTATFRHPLATLDPAIAQGVQPRPVRAARRRQHAEQHALRRQVPADPRRDVPPPVRPGRLGPRAGDEHAGPVRPAGQPALRRPAPLWAKGEYFPLAYSRTKVEEVTRQRLVLKP